MKILLLEDNLERVAWFKKHLTKDIVYHTEEPLVAIELLKMNRDIDRIYLDHDLLSEHYVEDTNCDITTGLAVAKFLADNPKNNPNVEIIIHSKNWNGVGRMASVLVYGNRKVLLYPFSIMSGLNT